MSFRGKTVRMIVGSAAGGLTDIGARLFARFIVKYLPGNPTLVVQNVPGASGVRALNYFVSQAAADGLTFVAGSSSNVVPDVLRRNPAVQYDPVKFHFIGGVANPGTVLVVNKAALPRLTDPSARPVALAQVGGTRTAAQAAIWGAEYLGWNLKWVSGYEGTTDFVLALMRGEADMIDSSGTAVLKPLLEDGRFAALAQTGVVVAGEPRPRGFAPDTPLLSDLLSSRLTGPARAAYASWLRTTQLGKFFALPPGAPTAAAEAFRRAFQAAGEDPELLAMARRDIDADYVAMTAADTRDLIAELSAIPDADLDFLLRLREKYGLAVATKGAREE